MTAKKVEWVLVVRYQLSHHKAIYGRLAGQGKKDDSFSKDFIQLSSRQNFLDDIDAIFGANKTDGATTLLYRWAPDHEATGSLVFRSADRPHLSWEFNSAPAPWKMVEQPTAEGIETIPGEPDHRDRDLASAQFSLVESRGGGQPFLLAIKLNGETDTLHLRAYLNGADEKYDWASTNLLPVEIRDLLAKTSPRRTLAWLRLRNDDQVGLTFDPQKNHDAWSDQLTQSDGSEEATEATPDNADDSISDAAAETLPRSETETEQFREQINGGNYEVDDQRSTVRTRGSAQRAFSDRVKKNYEGRCAVTGIKTRSFLIAAHIVPWSQDKTIRLDPSNGICLSALMDKAFELGYIMIDDDLSVTVDWTRIGSDSELGNALEPYDGGKLRSPLKDPPKAEYLRRRRELPKHD
ncbi:HNH endonuclease [uncultured Brevundimonas sp.]|uniref:HNH endonuclease n=1 Tax=uncultured Brevundimonas sp. TaxID=213418 RepID=UPI0025ED6B75|nr:HNH endonuclease [uncultured Brevundimonas sp.]